MITYSNIQTKLDHLTPKLNKKNAFPTDLSIKT